LDHGSHVAVSRDLEARRALKAHRSGQFDSWRIHHKKGGVGSPWNGDYQTPDAALIKPKKQY